MSKISKDYTTNAIQKMVVDALEKDGAFCNYYEKYYLEPETYDGGTGDRLAFKNYNDKIVKYHVILKVLTGERRANIYEAIPVIDFAHPANTGFNYTYKKLDDNSSKKIDPTVIVPIRVDDNDDALTLIDEEDKYTINRVLTGDSIAEHFYNTKEFISSSYNIQTTFPGKDNAYVYNGVQIPPVIMNGEEVSGTRKTSTMVYRVTSPVDVYFNPMDTTKFDRIEYKTYVADDLKTYLVDSSNNNHYIILNTDCGWQPQEGIGAPINFEGEQVAVQNPANTKARGTHYLSLKEGDMLVAIPSTTYSLDPNKILVIKSKTSSSSYVEETRDAIEGYLNTDGYFYKEAEYVTKYDPAPSDVYIDANEKANGNLNYYQYDATIKKYFQLDSSQLTPTDSTGLVFTVRVPVSSYQCYILYVDNFNSGLASYTSFTEMSPGEKIDSLAENTVLINILKNYLDIESCYYGTASGLMNGYFCEPEEYTAALNGRTVTKWKFVNDVDVAAAKGVSIDIGSKYYSGHLLGRGYLKDEPLKLTASDYLDKNGTRYYAACSGNTPTLESIGIKGKATLIYKKLLDDKIIDRLFQSSEVSNWSDFESRAISNVITKFDYSNRKLTTAEALDLIGTTDTTGGDPSRPIGSIMAFEYKFYRDGEALEYEDFLDYIDFFDDAFQDNGTTLVLDTVNRSDSLVAYGKTTNKKFLGCDGAEQWWDYDSEGFKSNNTTLSTEFGKAFSGTYCVHYKGDKSTILERKFPYVYTVSPLALTGKTYISSDVNTTDYTGFKKFIRNLSSWASANWLTKTITVVASIGLGEIILPGFGLVFGAIAFFCTKNQTLDNPWTYTKKTAAEDIAIIFPEYKKWFPENVLLISGKDLKLETYSKDSSNPTRGICSLLKPGYLSTDKKDRVLLFKVSQVKSFLFSKVNKVKFITDETVEHIADKGVDGVTFDYDGSTIAEDVYVYYLSPISLNVDNSLELFDWNDEKIDLSDYTKSNTLIASSYPDNYFPITRREATDGSYNYEIALENRSIDFDHLKWSIVIPGLPDFNNYSDLKACTKDGYTLESIAKLLYGEDGELFDGDDDSRTSKNISSLIKRILNSIISTWPLSDSESNPLLVKDLPELLAGLIEFGNEIRSFSVSDFEITSNGKTVVIKPENMVNFINRIENSETVTTKRYSLTIPTIDKYEDFTEEQKQQILEQHSFDCVPEVIKTRLLQIGIQDVINSTDKIRPSFTELYNVFNQFMKDNETLTLQECTDLDNYFGNGSIAFLSMGDEIEDGEIVHTLSSQFMVDIDNIYNASITIIKDTVNEALSLKDSDQRNSQLAILKSKYSTYYTAESIENAISLDKTGTLQIDVSLLKINPDTPEARLQLEYIKRGRSLILYLFGFNKYRKYTLDEFIDTFVRDESSSDYSYILFRYTQILNYRLRKFKEEYEEAINDVAIDQSAVENYLSNNDGAFNTMDNTYLYYKGSNKYNWRTICPSLSVELNYTQASGTCPETGVPIYYKLEDGVYTKLDPQPQEGEDVSAYYTATTTYTQASGTCPEVDAPTYYTYDQSTGKYVVADPQPTAGEDVSSYYTATTTYTQASGTCPKSLAPTYYELTESGYQKVNPQPQTGDDVSSYYTTDGSINTCSLQKSSTICDKDFNRIYDIFDINEDTLYGLADFAKTALEGTNTNTDEAGQEYYVKYVEGEDTAPVGRSNSLYFKRYKMLNNRLNRLEGNLWLASSYLRNSTIFSDMNSFESQYLESYDKFISVMPIADVESLTYMPSQEATTTTIQLNGKFYSDKELEALKSLINSVCTLNCTSCSVKDSCPFYDENEIVKMYCTGVETIDIWVKDNELNLIASDDDAIKLSEELETIEEFSQDRMKTIHAPYSEIKEKIISDDDNPDLSVYYDINDLISIRENLKETYGADYSDYVKDDLGWLSNARYGTVERNTIKNLLVDSETGKIMNDEITQDEINRIHPYKFMYDALFIKASGQSNTDDQDTFDPDDDSYIKYTSSYHRYPFSFEKGPEENRQLYEGTAKIKIPAALKIISYSDDEDDLYLVSDDMKDSTGQDIYPVIYLGKIKDVEWTFDLTDDGIEGGSKTSDDTRLYANDVAQWCMNYFKGNCADYPIGGWKGETTGVADSYRDRDQYWMEKVYKKVNGQWFQFSGRPRRQSGYSEALISEDDFDEIQSISGKPMIANFIDFVRKVSIRIYDSSTEEWKIPWVNENMLTASGKELDAEVQRSILPLMKTNLRLVVVKSGK